MEYVIMYGWDLVTYERKYERQICECVGMTVISKFKMIVCVYVYKY